MNDFNLECPIQVDKEDVIQLAHGGGGKLMSTLLEKTILPAFKNKISEKKHDSAVSNLLGLILKAK